MCAAMEAWPPRYSVDNPTAKQPLNNRSTMQGTIVHVCCLSRYLSITSPFRPLRMREDKRENRAGWRANVRYIGNCLTYHIPFGDYFFSPYGGPRFWGFTEREMIIPPSMHALLTYIPRVVSNCVAPKETRGWACMPDLVYPVHHIRNNRLSQKKNPLG